MATTITKVSDTVWGNKRVKIRTVTFTGNYATNGETVTAASVGLKKMEFVDASNTQPTAPTTSSPVGVTISADGTTAAFRLYEGAASQAPLLEKDNAEAYVAGTAVRAMFIGY